VILMQNRRNGDDTLVVAYTRDVIECNDNCAHCLGRRYIDALDMSMSIGTGKDASMKHVRQADVNCVTFLPRDARNPILAEVGFPYSVEVYYVPPSFCWTVF